MTEPQISVVIPAYNHAEFIERTVRSVLAQTTDARIEIIVVNDGSPDNTEEVLQPFIDAGQIKYVAQPNAGHAAARNRGLREATGKYINLLDDDDELTPEKLEVQLALFEKHPEAVCVYGAYQRVNVDGELMNDGSPADCPSGDVKQAFRLRNWILTPGQALIRGDVVRKLKGFDERIWGSDDWEFFVRLAAEGPFVFDPHVRLHYRQHTRNSSGSALRHATNHLKVVRQHLLPNVLLAARHQRAASAYFVPNLQQFVDDRRRENKHGLAAKGLLMQLMLRPTQSLRPRWWKDLARCALRRSATPTQS